MILPNGEPEVAEDFGGVLRDALSEFWTSFYEKCTIGTTVKIPCIRHDFGEIQWTAVANILIRGYQLTKYFPIQLSKVFLKSCFNIPVENEELIENFLEFICETDKNLLLDAKKDFESIDQEDLMEFFNSYDSKWIPTKTNLEILIRDIAHKEIVQKPAFVSKCFANCLNIAGDLSCKEILTIYSKLTPSVKNCLAKISPQVDELSTEESNVFSFLKKYLKETDDKMRRAFFRFSTGADLPIMNIMVTFANVTGIQRTPVAHTCSGLLQLPSTYDDYVDFRSEMNSVLNSNIWVMDII